MRRSWFALLLFALLSTISLVDARADEPAPVTPGPHRIAVALGAGLAVPGISDDGHWEETDLALAVEAGYAFELDRGLEIQGGVTYLNLSQGLHAVLPSLGVRPHLRLSRTTELGLTLRGALFFLLLPESMSTRDRTILWTGMAASVSPDVRVWISPRVAVELGPELTLATAKTSDNLENLYLQKTPRFASLGVVMRIVGAL